MKIMRTLSLLPVAALITAGIIAASLSGGPRSATGTARANSSAIAGARPGASPASCDGAGWDHSC